MTGLTVKELFPFPEERRHELEKTMIKTLEGVSKDRGSVNLVKLMTEGNYSPIEIMWAGFLLARLI